MKYWLPWLRFYPYVRVPPRYLHHSSRLFFSSEFYLTFSPPSILSLSPISCQSKTEELFTVKSKFWKHHLLRLSGKSSPLIVCNSSHPKIFYKSTLTVKLSPFSVARPCPYYRLPVTTLIYIFFNYSNLFL